MPHISRLCVCVCVCVKKAHRSRPHKWPHCHRPCRLPFSPSNLFLRLWLYFFCCQLEQLDRVNDQMNVIHEDIKSTEKNLDNLEKCCGIFVLPWKRWSHFFYQHNSLVSSRYLRSLSVTEGGLALCKPMKPSCCRVKHPGNDKHFKAREYTAPTTEQPSRLSFGKKAPTGDLSQPNGPFIQRCVFSSFSPCIKAAYSCFECASKSIWHSLTSHET